MINAIYSDEVEREFETVLALVQPKARHVFSGLFDQYRAALVSIGQGRARERELEQQLADAKLAIEKRDKELDLLCMALSVETEARQRARSSAHGPIRRDQRGVVTMREPDDFQTIARQCDAIKAMLLEKNRKYGGSALRPVRIFSRADLVEQIKVRIDDKLSRLANAQKDEDEDVVLDLVGYLILLLVARESSK